jgi:hypothetical protein
MAQADSVHSAVRVLIPGAGAKPSTNPFRGAQDELIARLKGHPPGSIQPHPDDFEESASYRRLAYSTAILADTAQNIPSGLAGTLQSAVKATARSAA